VALEFWPVIQVNMHAIHAEVGLDLSITGHVSLFFSQASGGMPGFVLSPALPVTALGSCLDL